MSQSHKSIFIFLIISMLSLQLFANNNDSIFALGNTAYAENDFEQAISEYEKILTKDLESKELYFNLGNSYYKTRNYPQAILFFERALRLDPINDNIKFNLEKSIIYNIDQVDVIPEFVLKRGLRGFLEFFQSNTWALISLLTFILGVAMLLLYFLSLRINLKRIGFYVGIIALITSAGTFFLSASSKNLMQESNGAIVIMPTVTVKGSPSSTSTDLFIIHEGTKVYIQDQLNDWYEVKLSDGKQGWLQRSDIVVI